MPLNDQAGTSTRARLPRDERRAMLLQAALSAFSAQGYHATAMDEIAERAGVSKPVLYQHFDSKLELYLAIANQVRAHVVDTVEAALTSTTDNDERIEAAINAYFEFVDRPESGYTLVMASDMGGDPAVAEILEQVQTACAEAVGRIFQEQTDLGWAECVFLGAGLVGQVQAAARHWYDSDSGLPRDEAVALVRRVIWRGIGAVPQTDKGTSPAAEGG
ncbi:TetR/AcrR family transcriptional regulator [Ornithinimicrobium panacihumi]|uniref:TetR/AcrR family transcriptional regulator n=1 Tax=Ornithinimicrobium panacihumi TaxID=2008449 RepID=UPI003F88BC06